MHQMRPRNTGVNRHGVVVPLDDDDELLQPVYQEPFQVRKNVLPPALDPKLAAAAAASEVTTKRGLESAEAAKVSIEDVHSSMDNLKMVEPATLQLVRKGRTCSNQCCRVDKPVLPILCVILKKAFLKFT